MVSRYRVVNDNEQYTAPVNAERYAEISDIFFRKHRVIEDQTRTSKDIHKDAIRRLRFDGVERRSVEDGYHMHISDIIHTHIH